MSQVPVNEFLGEDTAADAQSEGFVRLIATYKLQEVKRGLETMMFVQGAGAAHLAPELRTMDQADFRESSLGAFVELGELVNECQWKSWRAYSAPTEEELTRMLDEGADLLTFVARMFNILNDRFGIKPVDWAEAFMRVAARNEARFKGEVPGREPPTMRCVGGCVDCSH